MVIKHKKKAVALVLVVMVITSLSLLVMGSVKVMTRNHVKYTTGYAKGGEINTNQSKGKFICYLDSNGRMQQILVKYKPNGELSTTKNNSDTKCTFTIPKQANSFKITLIGGGGGGAISNANLNFNAFLQDNGEDSIVVGANTTTFTKLFTTQKKYLTQDAIKDAIYENFFSNLSVIVSAKSHTNGTSGGRCKLDLVGGPNAIFPNFKYLLDKRMTYRDELNDSRDAYLKNASTVKNQAFVLENALKKSGSYYNFYEGNEAGANITKIDITAIGGLPKDIKDLIYTSKTCRSLCPLYGVLKGTDGLYDANLDGRCTYKVPELISSNKYEMKDKQSDSESITDTQPVGATLAVTYNDNEYKASSNTGFRFRIKHNQAKISEGQAGEPGSIYVFESRFIAKDNVDKIEIPKSAIGKGGAGGTESQNKGLKGGATKLNITTNVGTQEIKANGGAGGKSEQTTTLENYPDVLAQQDLAKEQIFSGKNGLMPNVVISSDFKLNNLNAGMTNTDTDTAIATATFPGSSGASGTLIWNEQGNKLSSDTASPKIVFIPNDGGEVNLSSNGPSNNVSDYMKRHTRGGEGANGAIIIEW